MMNYDSVTIAEMVEQYDFIKAVLNIPEIQPEKIADNGGYIGKHGENMSMYDAMMAEIMDDRNAEKAKMRNRRACERKARVRNPRYVKRNGGNFRRDVWYEGSKCFHWEEDLRMPERRERCKEKSDRADWEIDLRDLEWDIPYAEYEVDTLRDDIRDFNAEIQSIEHELSNVDNLRERLERLRKSRDEAEGYLRNSEEFLRKYNYVKEMI